MFFAIFRGLWAAEYPPGPLMGWPGCRDGSPAKKKNLLPGNFFAGQKFSKKIVHKSEGGSDLHQVGGGYDLP